MTQKLAVLQSLWAMERRHTDGIEWPMPEQISRIVEAGYDGVSAGCFRADSVESVRHAISGQKMVVEGLCVPSSVEGFKPQMEFAAALGATHINLQADARPRKLSDALKLIEGWRKLAEQAPCPVYFETHRDRVTTDLFFVLDLLDAMPDLPLLADLSHFLVGREFPFPVSDENHALIHRVLDNSWALHGRVATREQAQIEISFPHHKPWVDLFLGWWRYGMQSWRKRAGDDALLCFTCELGPKPYAITGRDGNDTTDRWAEALMMKEMVKGIWVESVG
jgi:hypothetical protein